MAPPFKLSTSKPQKEKIKIRMYIAKETLLHLGTRSLRNLRPSGNNWFSIPGRITGSALIGRILFSRNPKNTPVEREGHTLPWKLPPPRPGHSPGGRSGRPRGRPQDAPLLRGREGTPALQPRPTAASTHLSRSAGCARGRPLPGLQPPAAGPSRAPRAEQGRPAEAPERSRFLEVLQPPSLDARSPPGVDPRLAQPPPRGLETAAGPQVSSTLPGLNRPPTLGPGRRKGVGSGMARSPGPSCPAPAGERPPRSNPRSGPGTAGLRPSPCGPPKTGSGGLIAGFPLRTDLPPPKSEKLPAPPGRLQLRALRPRELMGGSGRPSREAAPRPAPRRCPPARASQPPKPAAPLTCRRRDRGARSPGRRT